MKKTLSVNLGGTVFNIDEDAYVLLTDYLQDVKLHLGDEASSEEVLNDIEQRMSELFTEWMQGRRQVVTKGDVGKVIGILGRPEQYDNAEEEGASAKTESSGAEKDQQHTSGRSSERHRKLYRDPENAVLGGVCTGLSNYLNISVILLRIIFFLLVWFGLSGVLMYILCWIIIPEARTASQRLEMQGEEVTIDNIEKKVREEYSKAKDRVGNYVSNSHIDENARSIGHSIGQFFVVIMKAIVGLIAGIIGLTGFIILMTLLFVLIVVGTGSVSFLNDWTCDWMPVQQLLLNPSTATLMTLGLILIIGIPFIAIFNLLFGRALNLKPAPKWLTWTGLILWLAGLVLIIFSGVWYFNQFGGFWI